MKFILALLTLALCACNSTEFSNFARTEVESYPMGNGKHNVYVRGNIFADAKILKAAFYKKANELYPEGFVVESIENKTTKHGGDTNPALEAVIKKE